MSMTVHSESFQAFLNRVAPVAQTFLCSEIKLHLGVDLDQTWSEHEQYVQQQGLPAPYWSQVWPGGQGLARYILDNPQCVAGLRVLDVGSGSGLCAIAAAKAGARTVQVADIDMHACMAVMENAHVNGVQLSAICSDLIGTPGDQWDVVLAADLWYERFLALRMTTWLKVLSQSGLKVFLGDLGRAFLPRQGLHELAQYTVPDAQGQKQGGMSLVRVFEFKPGMKLQNEPPIRAMG